jgi:hypothetical protein
VPKKYDVVQIFELDEVCHIGNVSVEVHLGTGEVHPFAQAGEGSGIHIVSFFSESTGDGTPTPAPEPSATDQYVMCHPENLLGELIS